jgi:hypothetical protein
VKFLFRAPGALLNEIHFYVIELQPFRGPLLAFCASKQCADARKQFIGAERLDEVIIRAGVESAHAIRDEPLGGQHEHRHPSLQPPELRAEREAVQLRHHYVEQDQIRLLFDRAFKAGRAIVGGNDAVTFDRKAILQSTAHWQFVLNYQHAFVSVHFDSPFSGSSIVKQLPFPGSLRTRTCPSCASTISLTMLNPIPAPGVLRRSSEPTR